MIEIRKLKTLEDYKRTIEIQKDAWGFTDLEIDPPYLMSRVQKYGGLVQGLFLDDTCVGFSYGIIGVFKGEYFIFSYMTAVLQAYQGRGFGFLLKKAQREETLRMGYNLIKWNFDPLEALNAYFNHHRLGVICTEYERNIYGGGESGLHKGLPTDRLTATWELKSPRVIKKMETKEPKIIENNAEDVIGNFKGNITYIEIPKDIQSEKRENINQALQWRMRTRKLFESAFKNDFIAVNVVYSENQERIFFKLIKKDV